jgi:hypothetical protein
MNFRGKTYIEQYLAALPGGQVVNDAAAKYGVRIREALVADGQLYWRVIGVHHLKSEEGEGTNTVLVEALDEHGNRIREGKVWAANTFEGSNSQEVRALDKASTDPMGCDFPMFKHGTYSVWMEGATKDAHEPSDHAEKFHTRHDDEGSGATWGHHSFFVVFQRTLKGPTVLDEAAVLATGRRLRQEQMDGNAPFAVYARKNKLGAPVTAEFSAGGFRARGYVGGIVYAPIASPDKIKHMAW